MAQIVLTELVASASNMASDENGLVGRGRKAIVVGCGPSGALMAIYLARMDWKVEVYESRPVYGESPANNVKAYDIILGPRGLDAIHTAGAELEPNQGVQTKGFCVHLGRVGKTLKVPIAAVGTMINRDVLSATLYRHGKEKHPGVISYQFEHKLTAIDFGQKSATFSKGLNGSGGTLERSYCVLVGADGVWSRVRRELAEKHLVTFQQQMNPGCSRVVEVGKVSEMPGADESWANLLHVWTRHAPSVGLLGFPTPEGRFRLLMGSGRRYPDGVDFFSTFKTEEDIAKLFKTKFPDVFGSQTVPTGFARQLLNKESIHNGVTTLCSAFHAEDSVVLVGDSAHSVFPNAGQGCNCALESCRVLAELLAEHDGDLSKALPAFTAVRKPDTDALASWSKRQPLHPLHFVRGFLLQGLHKVLPFLFQELAEDKQREPRISYAYLESLHRWQDMQLLMLLSAGIGVAAFVLRFCL